MTGGGGYLGSVLTEKLLAKGYSVRLLDPLWYGTEPIDPYRSNPKFELVQEDMRNLLSTVRSLVGVDAVIHLASIVGMPASSIEPKTSEEINYLATKNIAELCQIHEIETYIFASTCSVYGAQPDKLITEKSPTNPLDFYAKHKFLSERAVGWLNRAPTVLRFGTLFGLSPRMRFDLVINLFIAQALAGDTLTVHGGKQYRPFLHVADAADSLIFALENNLTGTYNVITENSTIEQVAKQMQDITGCTINVSSEIQDARDYRVSAKKINQMGFIPKMSLKHAFTEIKEAFKDGILSDYNDPKYNNYKLITNSKDLQKQVFIQGLPTSKRYI